MKAEYKNFLLVVLLINVYLIFLTGFNTLYLNNLPEYAFLGTALGMALYTGILFIIWCWME